MTIDIEKILFKCSACGKCEIIIIDDYVTVSEHIKNETNSIHSFIIECNYCSRRVNITDIWINEQLKKRKLICIK